MFSSQCFIRGKLVAQFVLMIVDCGVSRLNVLLLKVREVDRILGVLGHQQSEEDDHGDPDRDGPHRR